MVDRVALGAAVLITSVWGDVSVVLPIPSVARAVTV